MASSMAISPAAQVEKLVADLERLLVRMQRSQGSTVKQPRAELDLLTQLGRIEACINEALQNSHARLDEMWGGDCANLARVEAVLAVTHLSDMNKDDQRKPRCKRACNSADRVLSDLGHGRDLRNAKENKLEALEIMMVTRVALRDDSSETASTDDEPESTRSDTNANMPDDTCCEEVMALATQLHSHGAAVSQCLVGCLTGLAALIQSTISRARLERGCSFTSAPSSAPASPRAAAAITDNNTDANVRTAEIHLTEFCDAAPICSAKDSSPQAHVDECPALRETLPEDSPAKAAATVEADDAIAELAAEAAAADIMAASDTALGQPSVLLAPTADDKDTLQHCDTECEQCLEVTAESPDMSCTDVDSHCSVFEKAATATAPDKSTALIVSTEIKDGVVYYCVVSGLCSGQFTSLKRYSDFVALEKSLAEAGLHSTPKLPRREVIGLRKMLSRQRFLDKRQSSLQLYLDHITQQPSACDNVEVLRFLQ